MMLARLVGVHPGGGVAGARSREPIRAPIGLFEHYEGALHGFAVPDFPVFDAIAAERHWQRVPELFAATLRGTAPA